MRLTRSKYFLIMPAVALFFLIGQPALAATDDVDVAVTIGEILVVEYTGDPVIIFEIGYPDLNEGSKSKVNQGDLNWWSNVAPWFITIERAEWETEDGDPDLELWLQVRSGPPDNGPWTDVITDPTPWITGNSPGSDTIKGIDWKIKDLTWDMQPGFYWCTVTIRIVPGLPPGP